MNIKVAALEQRAGDGYRCTVTLAGVDNVDSVKIANVAAYARRNGWHVSMPMAGRTRITLSPNMQDRTVAAVAAAIAEFELERGADGCHAA
jgi:hypothetical protein